MFRFVSSVVALYQALLLRAVRARGATRDAAERGQTLRAQYDVVLHALSGDDVVAVMQAVRTADAGAVITRLLPPSTTASGNAWTPGVMLGVRFSNVALLDAAVAEQLPLLTTSGVVMPYVHARAHMFARSATGDVLTAAQRVQLAVGLLTRPTQLVGSPSSVSSSPTDLPHLLSSGRVRMVALHDPQELGWLQEHVVMKPFDALPLDRFRNYFGENVALYFGWLQFYTWSLVLPAAAGSIVLLHQALGGHVMGGASMLYSVMIVVWAGVVVKMWRRRESSLAFDWGALGANVKELPRPQHRGPLVLDPATGLLHRREGTYMHLLRFALVTIPGMLVMLSLALAFTLFAERLRHQLGIELDGLKHPHKSVDNTPLASFTDRDALHAAARTFVGDGESRYLFHKPLWQLLPSWACHVLQTLPSLLLAVGIPVLDTISTRVARTLNEWENHRTDGEYRNALISKLVLFQFVNNFVSLFYIAFVQQDLHMLRERLMFLLLVKAAINNIQEICMPLVAAEARILTQSGGILRLLGGRAPKPHAATSPVEAAAEPSSTTTQHSSATLADASSQIRRRGAALGSMVATPSSEMGEAAAVAAHVEAALPRYDEYADLLEMCIQYAQVTLFAAVFPFAPILALLNNFFEMRTDAFKLCSIQRPLPLRMASLGMWNRATHIISNVAVITNIALLVVAFHQPAVGAVAATPSTAAVLVAVAVEHALLCIKAALEEYIPNVPASVMDRVHMEASARERLALEDAASSRSGGDVNALAPPAATAAVVASAILS